VTPNREPPVRARPGAPRPHRPDPGGPTLLIALAGTRDGTIEWAWPATAAALGHDESLAGRSLWEIVSPGAHAELATLLAAGEGADDLLVLLGAADGRPLPAVCTLSFADSRFALLGRTAAAASRSAPNGSGPLERSVRELETALEASTDQLRAALQRSARARDEERRSVLRDLHDGAQQQLLALGVRLTLTADEASTPSPLARRLRGLRRQLDEAVTALREIARGIYPAALAEQGIVAGLRAATIHSVPPVEVRGELGRRYPAEVEGAVYFTCLEAIQNAVRHADASRVHVDVGERAGLLDFAVVDDGRGFDPGARRPGSGLQNVSDRVRAVGGDLRISSDPGSGTTVAGSVPKAVAEAPTPR